MNRLAFQIVFASAVVFALLIAGSARAVEPIGTPPPMDSTPAQSNSLERQCYDDDTGHGVRIYPAVLTRRFGPVEEPAPQFFALRNSQEPGFDWSAGLNNWGWGGWGWGNWGWGGWGFRFGVPSSPFAFPGFQVGLVGYNPNFYRPWYSSPNLQVWSDRFPWYSPGGVGPNIYQPWYLQRNALPWYSPFGNGPNIYTPNSAWRMYYPWYSPDGPGPNIYTPSWRTGGALYW
jgi:hypothetical protein